MGSEQSNDRRGRGSPLRRVGMGALGLLLALTITAWWTRQPEAESGSAPLIENTPGPEGGDSAAAARDAGPPTGQDTRPESTTSDFRSAEAGGTLHGVRARVADALAEIEGILDPAARTEAIANWVAQGLKDEELANALDALTDPDLEERGARLRSQLLQRWAKLSPRQAADWVQGMSAGFMKADAWRSVARGWAEQSVEEAIAWARQLPEGNERDGVWVQLAYETVSAAPKEALTLAVDLEASRSRDRLIDRAAAEWAGRDPIDAAQWAQQIPAGEVRDRVLGRVVASWAASDPAAAATAAATEMSPGRIRDDAVVAVVQQWAQKDPRQAGEWVARFPADTLQETAAGEVIRAWTRQDAAAARTWVEASRLPNDLKARILVSPGTSASQGH